MKIEIRGTADIDVLRAHAVAAAMARARPAKETWPQYEQWYQCCQHLSAVVCTSDGVSMRTFYELCGVVGLS